MKIQIFSDLHLEFQKFAYPKSDCDLVVFAGDIHTRGRAIDWMQEHIDDKPVIYVLGNHEFYGKSYPKHIHTLKDITKGTNIHILENDHLEIEGINFFGCTLWTNFELFGEPRVAGYECQQIMNDYRKITVSPQYRKLRSIDVAMIHRRSLTWLSERLEQHKGEKNVVITHHGPSKSSLGGPCDGKLTNAAYVSDLDQLILDLQPSLWLHGHIHHSCNYHIGETQILSNPRGYPGEENPDFTCDFYVDI